MNNFPQIFTFYSFKGGVGRSMAVLNVAYGLVAKGRNVLVLDMDLEAPGLSGFLRRQKEIGAFARCDVLDLVRWAADFSHACQQSSEPLDAASFPPLTDFIVSVPREKLQSMPHPCAEFGRLDIIPVDEERDYYDRLTALAMGGYQQDALVRMGSILHAWLKSRRFPIEVPDYYGPNAERTSAYDYVLVDSRTGVTETGGLCIGPLSDQLVVLTALNDQNIQGTRRFLEEVGILAKPSSKATENGQDGDESARRLDPKPTLIVASPVPAGEIASKRERLEQLQAAVGKAVVKLSYHPLMALMESIFTRDYQEEYLASEYDTLLRRMLDMAGEATELEVSPAILKKVWGSFSEWRDILARIFRLGSAVGRELGLAFLLSRLNRKELCEDRDFVLWDRVCRMLSNDKRTVGLEVFLNWANILSQWSQCSTQPDLARLRRRAAVQCYEQILQDEEASSRQKAEALINRGVDYGQAGDVERAITDYTAVVQMPDASAELKAQALFNRGVTYKQAGDAERGIADYTAVIEMPDAPSEQKANALLNRGVTYGQAGDGERAIADCTAVIQMTDAPTEQKAKALVIHGGMYGERGDAKLAIADYTAVIQMPDAPAEQKAKALVIRGGMCGEGGDAKLAIADYTAVIQMPDAPVEQKAQALVDRGATYGRGSDTDREIADYTAVIEMPDAPAEQKAEALYNRGVTYGEVGDAERAIADYTAVIQMPDASAEQKTEALVARGWCYFLAGRIREAIEEEEHAVSLDAANWSAHANLAVALLADGQTDAALMAYDGALALAAAEDLGEIMADLEIALEKYGPIPVADQVKDRIEARRKSLERGAAVKA